MRSPRDGPCWLIADAIYAEVASRVDLKDDAGMVGLTPEPIAPQVNSAIRKLCGLKFFHTAQKVT